VAILALYSKTWKSLTLIKGQNLGYYFILLRLEIHGDCWNTNVLVLFKTNQKKKCFQGLLIKVLWYEVTKPSIIQIWIENICPLLWSPYVRRQYCRFAYIIKYVSKKLKLWIGLTWPDKVVKTCQSRRQYCDGSRYKVPTEKRPREASGTISHH